MNSVTSILQEFSRPNKEDTAAFVDIITFCESTWGLNTKLWPAQKWLLKLFYGVPLGTDRPINIIEGKEFKGIPVWDQFMMELKYELSEVDFLHYLHDEGRCNVRDQSELFTDLLLAVGRRGSKSAVTSMISSYEIYKLLARNSPHEYYRMLDVGRISISAVATNSKQAGMLYNVARGYISKCRYFDPYVVSDTAEGMVFRTRADIDRFGPDAKGTIELLFRPAIGRGLRGPANIVCIFDEFAHFITEGQSSAEECYESATPSTATFKDPVTGEPEGKVISISSPLNRAGKFYKLFQQGMEGRAEGRLCIQAPSWEINPTISGKYLRKKYKEDPSKFLVEFGSEFSDRLHGWIRRDDDLLDCVDPDLRPRGSGVGRIPHFMGVDLGLVNNGTAISIVHLEKDVIVLDYIEVRYAGVGPYHSMDQLDFESLADWIEELCKKFYVWRGSFDQREGLPLEQNLRRRGLQQFEMEYSSRDKNSKAYQAFKLLLLDKKIKLYDWPIAEDDDHCEYIQELLDLQEKRLSKYQIEVSAPDMPGKFDDQADALARAVWMAQERVGDKAFNKAVRGLNGYNPGLRRNGSSKYSSHKSYQSKKLRQNTYSRQRVVKK